jgi:hypothetical protein
MMMSKKNKRYPQELREAVLKRLEPPTNDTITDLAKEFNISRGAIYGWINAAGKTPSSNASNKWTPKDKFHIVSETLTLTEVELAAYCRRKGIFPEEVKAWRETCISANTPNRKDPLVLEQKLREEKERVEKLERELRLKEKALAETAALLVLSKKAEAIWGALEED